MITYKEIKDFNSEDIKELFESVHWDSAKYPHKIVKGLKNSSVVISAWDEDKLVGLCRGLDDGILTAFIHYLLVNPKYQGQGIASVLMNKILEHYKDYLYIKIMPSDPNLLGFYEKFGFKHYERYTAMQIERFDRVEDEK